MKNRWGPIFSLSWLIVLSIIFFTSKPLHLVKPSQQREKKRVPNSTSLDMINRKSSAASTRIFLPLW